MQWMYMIKQETLDIYGLYFTRALVFSADEEQAWLAVQHAAQTLDVYVKRELVSFWNIGAAPRELTFDPSLSYGNSSVMIFETGEDYTNEKTTGGDQEDFQKPNKTEEDDGDSDLVSS